MLQNKQIFNTAHQPQKSFSWGDLIAIFLIVVVLYIGIRLAFNAPAVITRPEITLSPSVLPLYTMFSLGRMLIAYCLSILFTMFYGRVAAANKKAELILMPLLDVLQSVPILSFLPVVLLSLSAILPIGISAEIASIVLIFTSQVWNLTFAWYQSLTTIPKELHEASSIFKLNPWLKFKTLELPFGTISFIWNSMMSWAGGWFFLMAAEIFTVGSRDFRLPGLGAYLHEAANQNNYTAILWGLSALILTVVMLDQFIWRPLIAWSDRFKVEMVENDNPPKSWFYTFISNSKLAHFFSTTLLIPLSEKIDNKIIKSQDQQSNHNNNNLINRLMPKIMISVLIIIILVGVYYAGEMLFQVPFAKWGHIGTGLVYTFLRVILALILALLWTIPVGVAIGTNPKVSAILQPFVQIAASIPATALFPVLLLFVLNLRGGLNIAAILLMLMGTQWYLLFNIIAGSSAIPQDLIYTSKLLGLSNWHRWRILILPAIFPYLVTGAITASGGAWNASIVAEYQHFGGRTIFTSGLGSLISQATASGDYPLLLAATVTMILAVILVNRLIWRRLYLLAENKYRME